MFKNLFLSLLVFPIMLSACAGNYRVEKNIALDNPILRSISDQSATTGRVKILVGNNSTYSIQHDNKHLYALVASKSDDWLYGITTDNRAACTDRKLECNLNQRFDLHPVRSKAKNGLVNEIGNNHYFVISQTEEPFNEKDKWLVVEYVDNMQLLTRQKADYEKAKRENTLSAYQDFISKNNDNFVLVDQANHDISKLEKKLEDANIAKSSAPISRAVKNGSSQVPTERDKLSASKRDETSPPNEKFEDITYQELAKLISGNTLTASHKVYCADKKSSVPCLKLAILEPLNGNKLRFGRNMQSATIILPDKQTITKADWGDYPMSDHIYDGLHTGIESIPTNHEASAYKFHKIVKVSSTKNMFRIISPKGDDFIDVYIQQGQNKQLIANAEKKDFKQINTIGQKSLAEIVFTAVGTAAVKGALEAAANSGSSSSSHVPESKKVDSKKVMGNFECSFMCYDYGESVLDWGAHTSSEKTINIVANDKSAAEKIGRDAATKECKNMGHFDAYSRWGKGTISCIKQ